MYFAHPESKPEREREREREKAAGGSIDPIDADDVRARIPEELDIHHTYRERDRERQRALISSMALPGRIRGSGARGRGLRRPMAAAAAAAIPPPSSSSPSPSSGASPLPLPRAARGSGGSPTSVAFPGFGSGQGSASASSLDGLSKGDKECFQNLLEMEEESIGTEDGVEDQELDRLLSELEGGGEDGSRRGGGGGGGSRPQAPSSAAGGAGRTTMALWLMFWLFNNVALTVLNKATFSKFDFRYPFFLSFFHMMCNWAGGEAYFRLLRRYTSRNRGAAPRAGFAAVLLEPAEVARLDRSGTVRTWLFSVVFSMNIAIGNVSLRYVSVNFNQVMRSLVPAVAILIGCCMGKSTSGARLCAVVPVVGGVAMACFGEMQVTAIGFVFTCLCVVLAALKVSTGGFPRHRPKQCIYIFCPARLFPLFRVERTRPHPHRGEPFFFPHPPFTTRRLSRRERSCPDRSSCIPSICCTRWPPRPPFSASSCPA